MAQRSWPWDSIDEDRPLATDQWSRGHTSLATNGVVPGVGDELEVVETSPESLAVDVSLGRHWVEGRLYEVHSEPVEVPLAAADPTNPRIDRIVVRRSISNREVTVEALTGTPAADPDPPSLTQNTAGVWEEPLARVFVGANASSVDGDDITDERRWATAALLPGYGWIPIDDGEFSGGSNFHIDATRGGLFPAGTFSMVRLWLRGRVDTDPGEIRLRVNGDNTAGLYRTGHRVTNLSDGSHHSGESDAMSNRWNLGQWRNLTGNTAQIVLLNTDSTSTMGLEATVTRIASRISEAAGRLESGRLLDSLQVLTDGPDFDPVRWWLEGYRGL